MRIFVIIFVSLFCWEAAGAQSVEFDMPALAGSSISLTVFQGEKNDTVAHLRLPADGKNHFTLPSKYQNYRGVVSVAVNGKSLNLMITGENIRIAYSDVSGVLITQSTENDTIISKSAIQQAIRKKIGYLYEGLSMFADRPTLFAELDKEFRLLGKQYDNYRKGLTDCNLYACRYLEFSDFVNGYATHIFHPQQQQQNYAALLNWFENQLMLDDLYTSGMWGYALATSLKLINPQEQFANLMLKKLSQIRDQKVFDDFANQILIRCQEYDWVEQEEKIAAWLSESPRLQKNSYAFFRISDLIKGKIGVTAHKIEGVKNLKNTLLVFYDSGCSHCQTELQDIQKAYEQLQKQGIQIVSIAADVDKQTFENTAKTFQWKHKLCDFQGLDGVNFSNYGIRGTPTLFYIDKQGKIAGKYALFKDTKLM